LRSGSCGTQATIIPKEHCLKNKEGGVIVPFCL
jgi:hypothetical protein